MKASEKVPEKQRPPDCSRNAFQTYKDPELRLGLHSDPRFLYRLSKEDRSQKHQLL